MFSYYGGKRYLAHLYPEPMHEVIIEPFAGSAGYALHGERWRHEVLLLERDRRLAEVWQWLVDEATPATIASLPDLQIGERSSDFLAIVSVATRGANVVEEATVTPELAAAWARSRAQMARDVGKVKHWQIRCADFRDTPDVLATWFIDPPYQGAPGGGYVFGSPTLDFDELATWTRSRQGQVLACESGCATYLPFNPLRPEVDQVGDPHAEFVWHLETSQQASLTEAALL